MPANVPEPISQLPQITGRDPNGIVPYSALLPLTTFGEKVADFLGQYNGFTVGTRPLTAATTAGLPTTSLGLLLSVVMTSTNDAYPMQLQQGVSSTSVPLVVQPTDFNSVTNPAVYRLLNWHAASLYVEGISGAGFLSFQPQAVLPTTPSSTLQAYYTSSYTMVVASPLGSVTIPVSGYPQSAFLQRNGTWSQAVSGLYTPSTVSAWNGPPPTTIQQALDRLAAVASSKP